MPFHPRGRISVRSRCSGQEDSGSLLAAPVSLTLYVHDGDDRTLLAVLVLLDRFAYARRQRVRFFESDFSVPRARKASGLALSPVCAPFSWARPAPSSF